MKGFTLIEVLTVVMIVAILASVALPQYQRAVEKSRAAEAMTMGKVIVDSQNRLIDAFPNDNAGTRGSLDIILSGGSWSADNRSANVYTTPLFEYTLMDTGVSATRRNGGFEYTLTFYNSKSDNQNSCSGSFCTNMASLGFVTE